MNPFAVSLIGSILASLLGFTMPVFAGAASPEQKPLLEWTFDRDGDLQGWQPNGHLADVRVAGGTLVCRAVGADPILEQRSPFELPASSRQVLEVRLKADRDGVAEFFWSNTPQGRYGGFSQDKTTRFNVRGDGQWRTYRLLPFWHPEKKIVRLRFDVYDAASFEVDFIRIVELPAAAAGERAEFDFAKGDPGWQAFDGISLARDAGGLSLVSEHERGFVLAPSLLLKAEEQSFVSLRLAADRGRRATLFFATEARAGLHSLTFPIEADGREHFYNVDMLAAPQWRGRVLALGLRPSDAPGTRATLRWLRAGADPQGPPQLKVLAFALEDALPRAGVPATLAAFVSNTGGKIATNLRATLTLPPGAKVVSANPEPAAFAALGFGEEVEFRWQVQAARPLAEEATLNLSAANGEAVTTRAPLEFTRRLAVPPTGYVPEPRPVRGPFEVGVYYFPGWKSASQWHPLERFPERKPVLGWYPEGDPEVADWHIKWAVEHGLTFFAYDWYWSRGARQLEHALHDGYFKARYRHLLKFCLLWANHNPPKSSSPDDCLAVTRFWIEHYFRRPEHLTLDGRPVVIIFSPHRLTEDLGSAGVKQAFEAMRAECRRAGLPGLHLVACVGDAGGARQAAAEGFDAVTAYNWPHLGMTGEGNYAPFETLLDGYRRQWRHILEQSPIPLQPLPVCGGWDSRPWHGDNNLVRFGRTPGLFKQHLEDAKRVWGEERRKTANVKMVLVEAWNEWGEGSYIEPHREFGFGYLDAIREVFTDAPRAHEDVTPADVGLGPYDVPREAAPRTAWDFEQSDEGWVNTMDLAEVRAARGVLSGRSTGHDPAFFGPPTQARASAFPAVGVRLRLSRTDGQAFTDQAQLFWRTRSLPESEGTSARFQVTGDGQWHEYRIPVGQSPRWRGVITRLRLDPCNQSGVKVEVDSIRFLKAEGGK